MKGFNVYVNQVDGGVRTALFGIILACCAIANTGALF